MIDSDIRHHSGQNVLESRGAAVWVRNKFFPPPIEPSVGKISQDKNNL